MAEEEHTLEDAYALFHKTFANSKPLRAPVELAAAIRASGTRYEDVTLEWLQKLNRAWVFGESDSPFESKDLNRNYWRLVA